MCDALPGVTVEGHITAINPLVESETRNIQVQATVANKEERLRPGMFVNVAIDLPVQDKVLTIPATSVLYAPYGDSVFVIGKQGTRCRGAAAAVRSPGRKRGDFIAVSSGLNEGDKIVSTGVFKLRNGQAVAEDNRLAPNFKHAPSPENN